MKQGRACDAIRARGFTCTVEQAPEGTTTEPKGTVVNQFPSPGTEADSGEPVTIQVSTYVEPTPTPTPTVTPTPPVVPDPGTTTNGGLFGIG
jgi:beta-lactam-binding protein with PASTA domain